MIHNYQGREFSAAELHYLQPSFSKSYLASITKNFEKEFLHLYDDNGGESVKTFGRFATDVDSVRILIASTPAGSLIVCVDGNSYEYLVYAIATLIEGRSFCPISPSEGSERLNQKLNQLPQNFRLFVGKSHVALPRSRPFDTMAIPKTDLLSQAGAVRPAVDFVTGQPFIYIFTSGTTGRSKIVMQREEGVLSNVDALIMRHRLYEENSVATCLPVYHVNALEFSFFATLLSGNKFHLFSKFNPLQMSVALQKNRIDILSLVPSIIHAFNQASRFLPKDLFSKTKYVVSAASPLSARVAIDFYSHFSCQVIQGYGLSEAVNFSLLTPTQMTEQDYRWSVQSQSVPSAGTAIEGNEVHVLDSADHLLGEGMIGEIAVRGFNVMYGYLDESPSVTFKEGFFRTGDLGFHKKGPTGESFFFITGRLKEIVKRHGVTVSLAEIERDLAAFPDRTFEAIAVGFMNDHAGEEVAVIMNSTVDTELDFDAISSYLRGFYSAPLRPRLFVLSKRPVRGPSGKSRRSDFLEFLKRFQSTLFFDKEILVIDDDGHL